MTMLLNGQIDELKAHAKGHTQSEHQTLSSYIMAHNCGYICSAQADALFWTRVFSPTVILTTTSKGVRHDWCICKISLRRKFQ